MVGGMGCHRQSDERTGKESKMAGKDMTEKALEAYNDVFADIVNNLVFHGRQEVAEEELEQGRERSVYQGEKGLREQERDTSKYWRRNSIRIAYIGLENETEAENDMPLRVMGYDGAAYRDQIRYEKDAEGKRKQSLQRYPVVTLVLYFDYEKRWNKPRTLHEALGASLSKELEPYVSDYRINVFDIAWLSEEEVAGFHSDFRIVADYFVQMRKKGTYEGTETDVRHMREVLQLLGALTDDDRFGKVMGSEKKGDEPKNMCEVLDKIERRGMERGIEQGIETINQLNARLIKENRIADLERSITDSTYQARLLAEMFPQTDR